MAKVTVELTLDQLIEAAKNLSLEEQLKLIQSLLQDSQLEAAARGMDETVEIMTAGEFTEEQLREEVLRQIEQVRTQQQVRPRPQTRLVQDLLGDFVAGEDLTVFTDLDEDDFQA